MRILPFWEEVIQVDCWVLEIIRHGYSIQFIQSPQFLVPGYQEHSSSTRRTAGAVQKGGGSATEGCNSTNSSRPGEEWVLQHLFLGTPKGWRPQTHPESEVLQLKCLQDFVQDGDSAVHHSYDAPTPVDDQRRSEGCLLSHLGGCSTPPVPQFQLAGHKLPIRNPSVWSVISPQKTLVPLIVWLRLLGIQLYAYLDLLITGESEAEVAVRPEDYSGPHPSRILSKPEKVRTSPHTGSCVHRGKVPDGPGETVSTGDTDPGTDHLFKILLQSRRSTSSLVCVADGSNAVVGGIHPPPYASHPVVPEAAVDPHSPLLTKIWSMHFFGGRTGSTCPRECRLCLPTPPSLSLRM